MPIEDYLVTSIQNENGQILTYQPRMQLRFTVPPASRERIVELIEDFGYSPITTSGNIVEVDLLFRQNRTIPSS